MKTWIKLILILLIGAIIGWIAGWFIVGYLGITNPVALNTLRVTWVLGILLGYLAGRYWKGF